MPPQPELLPPRSLVVRAQEGRSEPRLWIRRLTIWAEPGGAKVREVMFRPGLNIVWSPDGGDAEASESPVDAIGHGSGKTLLCRLLRYCLGENRFAPEHQRERISLAFPDGIVGADVMLDGVCWAIVRPLGTRRRHMAVAGGNLDEIAAGEGTSTGLEPFIEAVEQNVLTPELAAMIAGQRTDRRCWPVALAWLARDQECRFNELLEWRSAASDSDSPARGMTQSEKTEALRAFLRAITPEEQAKRSTVIGLEDKRRTLDQEVAHRLWEIGHSRARLSEALSLQFDDLEQDVQVVARLRTAAKERLAEAAKLPTNQGGTELETVREAFEAARSELTRLEGERIRLDTLIPTTEKMLAQLRAELPGISNERVSAESPICPICEVPIDRALAEGCGLSHKLPDVDACRERWQKRQNDIREEIKNVSELRQSLVALLPTIALATQAVDQHAVSLKRLEAARSTRESTWYTARRQVDDVERLAGLIEAQRSDIEAVRAVDAELEKARESLSAFRDKQARVLGGVTDMFDPIVRYIIGSNAQGRVSLSGKGLDPSIIMGGDRRTAAIDSLKVIAFDLAVLCLSMEGATTVPAFLIHDSPREADLGLSLYHRYFGLIVELEAIGPAPQFQYIVTTTTRPPDLLTQGPCLRVTLRGSPASERLLRTDL